MTEQEFKKMLDTLFPKQKKVVLMAAKGKSNKEIAAKLGLGLGSIYRYMTPVYRAMGIKSEFGRHDQRKRFLEILSRQSDQEKILRHITPAPQTAKETPQPSVPIKTPPAALGNVDIVTSTAIAIIKETPRWKEGVGELAIFEGYYPDRSKHLYLFGDCSSDVQALIVNVCMDLNIKVSFKSCLK